jgi:hypothetical protein
VTNHQLETICANLRNDRLCPTRSASTSTAIHTPRLPADHQTDLRHSSRADDERPAHADHWFSALQTINRD